MLPLAVLGSLFSRCIQWPSAVSVPPRLLRWEHTECCVPCHVSRYSPRLHCVPKSMCSRLMRHLFLIKKLFTNTLFILMTCLWLIVSICPSFSWGCFKDAAFFFALQVPNVWVLTVAAPCGAQGTKPSYQFPWENHSSLKLKSTLKQLSKQ